MFRAKIHTFFFLVSPIFRTLDFVYYGHKVEGNKPPNRKEAKAMKNMKMGKVLTFTTKEDAFGNIDSVITPIPAHRTPEMEFARLRLQGRIASYELSAEMPLAIAVELALHQARMQGAAETVFFKW